MKGVVTTSSPARHPVGSPDGAGVGSCRCQAIGDVPQWREFSFEGFDRPGQKAVSSRALENLARSGGLALDPSRMAFGLKHGGFWQVALAFQRSASSL
jgi:hypothetical protein